MDAISLSIRELPTRYHGHPAIESRLWQRAEYDEKEVLFSYQEGPTPHLLPVNYAEDFRLIRWGGIVLASDLRKPMWRRHHPVDVLIQAQALLDRKVWISVIEGIHGICVQDDQGIAMGYMVMVPSTDYYQIMTKSRVMPWLVGEVI
ncbi:MAG: hypothetical protein QM775_28425 [Pirellulales bacterium]